MKPLNNNKKFTYKFENKPFMRLSEITKILSINRATWLNWVKDGSAPEPVKFGPKTIMWHTEDIKNYFNSKFCKIDKLED
jgi:predicted DNA-binding transcriptional regulator AlpA